MKKNQHPLSYLKKFPAADDDGDKPPEPVENKTKLADKVPFTLDDKAIYVLEVPSLEIRVILESLEADWINVKVVLDFGCVPKLLPS